jgi:hypothetical protein
MYTLTIMAYRQAHTRRAERGVGRMASTHKKTQREGVEGKLCSLVVVPVFRVLNVLLAHIQGYRHALTRRA